MKEWKILQGKVRSVASEGICRGTTGNVFEIRDRLKIVFDRSGSNVRGFGVELEHWNSMFFQEDSLHIRLWKYHIYFTFTKRGIG